jgi:hypothetical protein
MSFRTNAGPDDGFAISICALKPIVPIKPISTNGNLRAAETRKSHKNNVLKMSGVCESATVLKSRASREQTAGGFKMLSHRCRSPFGISARDCGNHRFIVLVLGAGNHYG